MHLQILRALLFVVAALNFAELCFAAEPRAKPRYKLELIAADPEIVTPIGMQFDRHGRLLVVESHTHQRAEGYQGPESDRIRMLSDSNGDGKLDKWSTFADGFRHAMNLLACDDGGLYVVTRGHVFLLHDRDDDGVADEKKEILRLETEDDYPHNALGGIDRSSSGHLILGLGENHGLPFRLISSDGQAFEATGGVDGVFRCTPDGRNIEHLARGVWNPFSLCVLPDGRIFAVDNDPDASPPCRLLHIVPGGDYGYLYQYGRAGTHPLQCWNGELPGTLPMVCGVGEGPTAIVPHAGGLWVSSWGDHRIERYDLVPRGASYTATRDSIVQGDHEFRPTGMVVAPDGSLYFGDWVRRDYPVHGHGKIWRLVVPDDELKRQFPPSSNVEFAASDDAGDAIEDGLAAESFRHAHGVWQLAQGKPFDSITASEPRLWLAQLEAARLNPPVNVSSILRAALKHSSSAVRIFAVRWIADARMMALRDDVARLLDGPQPDPQLYMAALGAIDWLDRNPRPEDANFSDEILIRELKNSERSPEAHAHALAHLKPDNKFLTTDRLKNYLSSTYEGLRLEAVRTLAEQPNSARFDALTAIAEDANQSAAVRTEAIVGLASDAAKNRAVLERLAASKHFETQREAERVLRLARIRPASAEPQPKSEDLEGWELVLFEKGDPAAGRRLFFSSVGPKCSVCHTYGGRGGKVGPELTNIGGSTSRERIIASIIQPSREIAPDYQPWLLVTRDGKTHTGLRIAQGGDNGQERYTDAEGKVFTLKSDEIKERHASQKSIMPDNLTAQLSIEDLRDLVTFLSSPPSRP